MIVFSAHSNTVSDAPLEDTDPSSSCLLKIHLTGSSYECHCHMDNNYHNCTSIGNHQNENLRCKKSTVCLPETVRATNTILKACNEPSVMMTFQLQVQLEHLQLLNVGRKGVHKTPKAEKLVGITKRQQQP